jgi:hypothetical protein
MDMPRPGPTPMITAMRAVFVMMTLQNIEAPLNFEG